MFLALRNNRLAHQNGYMYNPLKADLLARFLLIPIALVVQTDGDHTSIYSFSCISFLKCHLQYNKTTYGTVYSSRLYAFLIFIWTKTCYGKCSIYYNIQIRTSPLPSYYKTMI